MNQRNPFSSQSKVRAWVLAVACTLSLFASNARAGQNTFAVDVAAGIPHLVSFELSYWGLGPFVVGLGFGSLPVNRVLQDNIPIDDRAISGGYTLLPTANYNFLTVSAFLRWFPFNENKGSGMFFDLNISRWKFSSRITGDLREDSSGNILGNAVNGAIEFQQPMATISVGYRSMITDHLFLHGGLGLMYLLAATHTTTIGGSVESVLPFAGQPTKDSFEQAKTDIDTQVNNGVDKLNSTTKILPSLWVNFGWVF